MKKIKSLLPRKITPNTTMSKLSITVPPVSISTGSTGYNSPYTHVSTGLVSNGGSGSSTMWTSTSWNSTSSIYSLSVDDTFNSSLVVTTKNGEKIDVVDTIDRLMKITGLINPNKEMLKKYPALKSAYDEYETQLYKVISQNNPELKEAYEQYKTMEALVKEDDDKK